MLTKINNNFTQREEIFKKTNILLNIKIITSKLVKTIYKANIFFVINERYLYQQFI